MAISFETTTFLVIYFDSSGVFDESVFSLFFFYFAEVTSIQAFKINKMLCGFEKLSKILSNAPKPMLACPLYNERFFL